ncbi:MAG: type II toxin-antitoxin system RatA family toxin [Burkholderia sp.]|nr:type II toxin-antitoxin system RatA family toxin [Burkholderia sp.]
MGDIKKIVLIHHSIEQMFDLVSNVNDYPNFLPWCSSVEILDQEDMSIEVKININFKGIKHNFATRNTLQYPTQIDMKFVNGPFRKFSGNWCFTPISHNSCKITFFLHYEFLNFLLEKIFGTVFSHIINTLVESFIKRADQQYGKEK